MLGFLALSDSGALEPSHSAAAGVDLNREGDEAEQGGHSEESYPHPHHNGENLDEHDARQQHPGDPGGGKTHHWHQLRAQLEGSISAGVLQGVSTLMSSNRRRCHTVDREHHITQVHGAVGRVVMVGELAVDTGDLHIVHAIVVQHLSRHITSSERQVKRFLRILCKLVLERLLRNKTQYRNTYKKNVYYAHNSN